MFEIWHTVRRASEVRSSLLLCVACSCLMVTGSGCSRGIPAGALAMSETTVETRALQTRRFDTLDETRMLSAVAGVMQDLGFNIDSTESELGLVVGSKDRDATEAGQVVGAVFMAALFGVNTPIDDEQKIRLSVVTRPLDGRQMSVRATFQRVVWNNRGQVSKLERIEDNEVYQSFFEKLSQSVFLEAHSP